LFAKAFYPTSLARLRFVMNVMKVVRMRLIVAITILVAVLPRMTVTVFRVRFQRLAAGQAEKQ